MYLGIRLYRWAIFLIKEGGKVKMRGRAYIRCSKRWFVVA